jgi:tetratricopeptide (TPR) repeat protein
MQVRTIPQRPRSWLGLLLVGGLLAPASGAQDARDSGLVAERALSAAERSLRAGELEVAESHYRAALLEGWLLMGSLEVVSGRLGEARQAFQRAAGSAVETRRALRSLALVELRLGEAAHAVGILTQLVARHPEDLEARRLLAQALVARGQPEQAVQELEEAHERAPEDLELAFSLASGYLRVGKPEAAERLFGKLIAGRPIPQTHVLIGRTYRDFGEYERARAELRAALEQDPRVRRAHYYLGRIAMSAEGQLRFDEAVDEFRRELELAPDDPLSNLHLGMALVETRRHAEAQPALERAARAEPPEARAFYYLGRCKLALGEPSEAVAALRRALELAPAQGAGATQLQGIHYHLALALREQGEPEAAAAHFADAKRHATEGVHGARDRLSRYLSDDADPNDAAAGTPPIEVPGLSALGAPERATLAHRTQALLARAYLNIGVMHAQGKRFGRAAELFSAAAAVDPGFPGVQSSLGVARFNAGQFAEAIDPLSRAVEERDAGPDLKRMLALAQFNSEGYAQAAALLRDDPQRDDDASLAYTFGVALVRSGQAAQAQQVFSRLLAKHGDSPELNVVLGQAHAQQGDYDAALEQLQRALARKPDVPEANATLGLIYLKQGRLSQAEAALRAEVEAHPADLQSQHHLATVLDLQGRPQEALPLLRSLLKAKPLFADARYLLGKILLAEGQAPEALEHLEAASLLAPEDANIRYQLGQAYQKLGRADLARQQFEQFRKLKQAAREPVP